MPRLPGVNNLDAVRALGKAGFRILRQGNTNAEVAIYRYVTVRRASGM